MKVRKWDSPRLRDDGGDDDDEGGTGNDERCLAETESELTEELEMDDKRFHRDDNDALKILTDRQTDRQL